MDLRLSDRPSHQAPSADMIDAAIDSALAENRIVGAVVLLAEDGELVYQRAAGLADREGGRAMRIDTPFRLASVTKPFTTMAALRLIDLGQLSPDDAVATFLPEFRPGLVDGTAADIRVSHLMTHTAGLDYRFQQPAGGSYEMAGISDGLDESDGTLAENVARIARVPLASPPGATWRYSVATDILGAVIEAVTGEPLDRAIQTFVCRPLQLGARFDWEGDDLAVPYRNTEIAPARMERITEVALPYVEGPGIRFDPDRIRRRSAWPSGGGGMAARAGDVLALLEAYRAGDFLSGSMRSAARASRIAVDELVMGPGWGFSWIGSILLDPAANGLNRSAGSVSWGGVYGNWWCIDFERRRTVVSLTNTAYEGLFGRYVQDIQQAAMSG